jgi:hypothetical protein
MEVSRCTPGKKPAASNVQAIEKSLSPNGPLSSSMGAERNSLYNPPSQEDYMKPVHNNKTRPWGRVLF